MTETIRDNIRRERDQGVTKLGGKGEGQGQNWYSEAEERMSGCEQGPRNDEKSNDERCM